jgi:hypothetical protein
VVLPAWDRTLPTLLGCLDATLRAIGGAPTYALTDKREDGHRRTRRPCADPPPDVVQAGRHWDHDPHLCSG